jgi:hypothetical protein
MGVTIHYAVGMQSGRVKRSLDRVQALAEEIKRERASALAVPFSVRRPSENDLLIDIGGCETLAFEFGKYASFATAGNAADGRPAWVYELSVLGRVFDARLLHVEDTLQWACAFCKTQFAASLVEHRWVAELIRSVASVAEYAHVYDEGGYYHTRDIEDAASAIHQNGMLIDALGGKLSGIMGGDVKIVRGGETNIKPL